jgi:hypothetical protein
MECTFATTGVQVAVERRNPGQIAVPNSHRPTCRRMSRARYRGRYCCVVVHCHGIDRHQGHVVQSFSCCTRPWQALAIASVGTRRVAEAMPFVRSAFHVGCAYPALQPCHVLSVMVLVRSVAPAYNLMWPPVKADIKNTWHPSGRFDCDVFVDLVELRQVESTCHCSCSGRCLANGPLRPSVRQATAGPVDFPLSFWPFLAIQNHPHLRRPSHALRSCGCFPASGRSLTVSIDNANKEQTR